MQFNIRRIFENDIEGEIKKTGFSPSYLDFGVLKHKFLNLKISNLKPQAATIIKQTALASNCDAAVHKGVLGCEIERSDLILSGSVKELETVANKLKAQQFSLPKISAEIIKQIEIFKKCPQKTSIMGILNITPNSFSDGGEYLDPEKALEHAFSMIEDGANIIDIGAESTRPGAKPADSNTEIERLTPVIKELRKNTDILISIDTRNSITARQMADFGADIINDVSGFTFDPDMAKTVAGTGLRAVINHSRGTPDTMDNFCNYEDLIDEIYNELYNMAQNAVEQGVQPDKIIIDPGFGFAKKVEQNFELLRRVKEFKSLGFPLLCGVSRKRFLQSLTGGQNTEGKPNTGKIDEISNMAAFYLASQNVDFIRVHDVKGAKIAVEMAQKMGF